MDRRATSSQRLRVTLADSVAVQFCPMGRGDTGTIDVVVTRHPGIASTASLCAGLSAAVIRWFCSARTSDDQSGTRAVLAGTMANHGLSWSLPTALPPVPDEEWSELVVAELEDIDPQACLRAWAAIADTLRQPERERMVFRWVTTDPAILRELALCLVELTENAAIHEVTASHSAWRAIQGEQPALDRLELIAAESTPSRVAHSLEGLHRAALTALVEERQIAQPAADSPPVCTPALEPSSDQSRSAAEAYLFAILELRDTTRGVFTLNSSLEFDFGVRACEADLCAAKERVVVEIDGYYHFLSSDAWRRDRRKDLALQLHGYTVIRCLAEDVVEHLDAILAQIDRALVHARTATD